MEGLRQMSQRYRPLQLPEQPGPHGAGAESVSLQDMTPELTFRVKLKQAESRTQFIYMNPIWFKKKNNFKNLNQAFQTKYLQEIYFFAQKMQYFFL